MVEDLWRGLTPVLDRLQTLFQTDPELRAQVRNLGRVLCALAAEPLQEEPVEVPVAVAPSGSLTVPIVEPTAAPVAAAESIRDVLAKATDHGTFRRDRSSAFERTHFGVEIPATTWQSSPTSDEDLPRIAERFRLKAEGSRWRGTALRRLRAGGEFAEDLEEQYFALIARAKELPECFLWMCRRDGPTAANLGDYEHLAGVFESAAAAAALLDELVRVPELENSFLEPALVLAAEAQSAVRVAVARITDNPDTDQTRLFFWLRSATTQKGFYIARFMRIEDPADPANWADLRKRLAGLDEGIRYFKDRGRRQKKLLGKIRYQAKRLQDDPSGESDWHGLVATVTELVSDGLPPSNSELRDLLLPVLEYFPDDLETTKEFALVLRESDRYLASRPAAPAVAAAPVLNAEVRTVAELMRGRALVLIGGTRRPAASAALVTALGLSELIWIEGRDQTYKSFEPEVARSDVALVILAIRWSRHGFGEVKEFCDKYDKPLVRLPGGYNVNQIAFHILHQVGERLAPMGAAAVGREH